MRASFMKHFHEFRDPIHNFVRASMDEVKAINSPAFQRHRNVHQLALTYLVYPGATHRRFEHCLGVMELAGRVFDVITAEGNREARSSFRTTTRFAHGGRSSALRRSSTISVISRSLMQQKSNCCLKAGTTNGSRSRSSVLPRCETSSEE